MNYTFCFSPTNGTLKVLNFITSEFEIHNKIDLSGDIFSANKLETEELTNQDCCFIAVPSFGGRIPALALARLKAIKANNTPAVLIVSFGNRAIDDTLLELKNELEAQGFIAIAAISAVTEHSMVREYGKGRPNTEDAKELKSFSYQIKQYLTSSKIQNYLNTSIEEFKNALSLDVPGETPYKKYNGVPFKPSTNKKCVHCGACTLACPVHAIPLKNPEQTDNKKCITCMRCVAMCPQNARQLNFLAQKIIKHKLKKVCETAKQNAFYLRGIGEITKS